MNLQVLDAMDHCEHATGEPFEAHQRRLIPKEIIGEDNLRRLKAAGYTVVQVIQTGNKDFPPTA